MKENKNCCCWYSICLKDENRIKVRQNLVCRQPGVVLLFFSCSLWLTTPLVHKLVTKIANLFCFEALFNAEKYSSFGIYISRFSRSFIFPLFSSTDLMLHFFFSSPLPPTPLGSSGSLISRSEPASYSQFRLIRAIFFALVRDPLEVVTPLSTDYPRDHNCSLGHVMSPETGSRISSTSCFLAALAPFKPRFSVIFVNPSSFL